MIENTGITDFTETETQPPQNKTGKCRTAFDFTENIFSLVMLSVFAYTSLEYLNNKHIKGGVDETLFWNIINHITPFFLARGIQLNVCSFIDNVKKICQSKANEHNQNLNDQPLLANGEIMVQ